MYAIVLNICYYGTLTLATLLTTFIINVFNCVFACDVPNIFKSIATRKAQCLCVKKSGFTWRGALERLDF